MEIKGIVSGSHEVNVENQEVIQTKPVKPSVLGKYNCSYFPVPKHEVFDDIFKTCLPGWRIEGGDLGSDFGTKYTLAVNDTGYDSTMEHFSTNTRKVCQKICYLVEDCVEILYDGKCVLLRYKRNNDTFCDQVDPNWINSLDSSMTDICSSKYVPIGDSQAYRYKTKTPFDCRRICALLTTPQVNEDRFICERFSYHVESKHCYLKTKEPSVSSVVEDSDYISGDLDCKFKECSLTSVLQDHSESKFCETRLRRLPDWGAGEDEHKTHNIDGCEVCYTDESVKGFLNRYLRGYTLVDNFVGFARPGDGPQYDDGFSDTSWLKLQSEARCDQFCEAVTDCAKAKYSANTCLLH